MSYIRLVIGVKECKPNQAGVKEKALKRLRDVQFVCVGFCSKRIVRQFHINERMKLTRAKRKRCSYIFTHTIHNTIAVMRKHFPSASYTFVGTQRANTRTHIHRHSAIHERDGCCYGAYGIPIYVSVHAKGTAQCD